ncbi:MAG TPA: universal stress protein [Ferruginibacter sp.]|nr:universal stress protein [Ferruginibacter sp.]
MNKYIAVFDSNRMSKSSLDYAIQLSQLTKAHLVAVFLDDFIYGTYDIRKGIKMDKEFEAVVKEFTAKEMKRRVDAEQQFQKACSKANIPFSIHRDKKTALQELKHESMFADLIVINANETFTDYKHDAPTPFMKDLLADVQCPVVVVPNSFKAINKIVLLYDGRPSALYAIKMFSYLFANGQDIAVEILTVKDQKANLHLPDNKLMREFIKKHFPKAVFTVLKGKAEEQITGYLRTHKENELLVLGAYRRSELSRWFKTSMADTLMKALDTPLFIAHAN